MCDCKVLVFLFSGVAKSVGWSPENESSGSSVAVLRERIIRKYFGSEDESPGSSLAVVTERVDRK